MISRICFLLFCLSCCSLATAQLENNLKLGVEGGLLLFSDNADNLGLFVNVEPKVKVIDNMFIGVRFTLSLNTHVFENTNSFDFMIDEISDNGIFSFTPTVDYYLGDFGMMPYVGVGLGYHVSANAIEVFDLTGEVLEADVNNRIGLLLRGGAESGRLRFGAEYNFIPKTDLVLPDGQVVGTVQNSYLGVSIGYLLVGGSSRKE